MLHTDSRLHQLDQQLASLRGQLLNHPIYGLLSDLGNLRQFMEVHVFAVWDFMSLLKSLQRELGGCSVPWVPQENPESIRLINEISLAEESDECQHGGFSSHFELYRQAMLDCEANTSSIDAFVSYLSQGEPLADSLKRCEVDPSVEDFVGHTFEVISSRCLPRIAASFTMGREDLLPQLFGQMVQQLNVKTGGSLEAFQYYLDRHIELDEEHHGPMAQRLLVTVCGESDEHWAEAEAAAVQALEARLRLWDAAASRMTKRS